MELPELPEWIKICLGLTGGAFAWGLVFYLSRWWIKKEIIDPIHENKKENEELKKSFVNFTEKITGFVYKVIKSNADVIEHSRTETSQMSKLFTEQTRFSSEAKMESYQALKKVNVLEKVTEENTATVDKLVKIATAVHDKNKGIETEVKKLSQDMVMVKTKVGLKDED